MKYLFELPSGGVNTYVSPSSSEANTKLVAVPVNYLLPEKTGNADIKAPNVYRFFANSLSCSIIKFIVSNNMLYESNLPSFFGNLLTAASSSSFTAYITNRV
jgi:hypothetical protein